MRKLLIAVVVVLVGAALYYVVAAPRVALAAIERAASADDVVALAYHLDLDAIRAGLRADFEGAPAVPASGDDPVERFGAAFGAAVGAAVGALVGTTVAELVGSPEGVLQLLGGVPLRPLLGGAPGLRNTVPATFDAATTRYEAWDALVLLLPERSDDGAAELVLRPRGFVWKVAEVRLPRAP